MQWSISAGNTGDVSSIPGLGRSLGGENATHSSILAWKIPWTPAQWATGHGITKSQTRLSMHKHITQIKWNKIVPLQRCRWTQRFSYRVTMSVSQSEREKRILYNIAICGIQKNGIDELICKIESQMQRTNLWLPWWGVGQIRKLGLTCIPCVCACSVTSVVSYSWRPYGLQPARFLCPWDFPQEYWSGLPFPPEDFPDPGFEPKSPVSPASQANSLLLSYQGSFVHILCCAMLSHVQLFATP